VTCGITFTFGGLGIDTGARVMCTDGSPIPGLYAAGEPPPLLADVVRYSVVRA
jgi:predicted oxidoreductase